MCCCPAHDDSKPSLHIQDINGKVLFYCFAGCAQADVIDALRARGLWPIPGSSNGTTRNPTVRSAAQRRAYALEIIRDTEALNGHNLAQVLLRDTYFAARGIKHVPPTAMLAGWGTDMWFTISEKGRRVYCPPNAAIEQPRLVPDELAMVFEVTDGTEVLGAHVTWLSEDKKTKSDPSLGPQRQMFGPTRGGFIKLYAGELDPTSKLIIAEGIETALSAAQIGGGIPSIAALSANNLPKISPPLASEYLICTDNDPPGLQGARALAVKLVRAGHSVRFAIPPRANSDWNDELMERLAHGEI
ncbi:MAG: toprim domain-containing protein [Rhodoplanes sp.]